MQGVVRTCLLLGGIAACHPAETTTPVDAAPVVGDGSGVGRQGLELTWSAPIPGAVTNEVTVSSLLIRIASLRVIGDAGPGDYRTSTDSIQVAWSQNGPPDPIEFTDAPTGLYSHVAFLADGDLVAYSYEIKGSVKIDGTPVPFSIHDRSLLPVGMQTSATLEPNHVTSIQIAVHLEQALGSVDWDHVDDLDGTLTLDTFDSGMNVFRGKMIGAVFSTDHPTADRPFQYHRAAVRFTLPIPVTSTDIDELGHVSNQVYLRWVLEVATAHSSHLGWSHAQYRELGGIFIVRRHELDYLAQVRLGDEIRAETWVASWKLASCVRATEILLGDRVVLRAQTTWAFMALATARPVKIPEPLRALFA